jgi:long-chain acyl-CoA synthetase
MNVLLKRREIAFYLEDSGAELLLAWHGFCEEARGGGEDAGAELIEVEPATFAGALAETEPTPGLAEVADDDTAVILYTSGTTGKPKGAELTHANLLTNADVSMRTTSEIQPGDVVFGGLPLFHSFGQTVAMNASLKVGACLTLVPKFEPGEALETIQRDGVTHFYGVPTMFGALLHHPERERFDTSAPASPAAPRCRSRCCAASSGPSAASCSRDTGCRRPPPSPRPTIPTKSASPARSAPRWRASRCG